MNDHVGGTLEPLVWVDCSLDYLNSVACLFLLTEPIVPS